MCKKNKSAFFIIIGIIFIILFSRIKYNNIRAIQTTKIVIDAGHGGVDYGCTIDNMHEKDITLDISNKVKKILENKGYDVLMTRDSDISLSEHSNIGNTIQKRDLHARANIINNSNTDIFISIHINSYIYDPDINGSVVFYFSDQYKKSKHLAQCIQNSLNDLSFEGKTRTSHKSRAENYYILRETAMPGVLIETAFLTNPRERKWLSTKEYKQKIAESISLGIQEHIDNYKSSK